MDPFPYRQLRGSEIRLLRPLANGSTSYELLYESLDNPPPYAALSYTWGPVEPQAHIDINGCTFCVRLDLYEALLALIAIMQDSNYLLWIDAICINQDDLGERSAQVLRMRQIYERSAVVYAWLGGSDELSRLAISKMTLLGGVIEEHSRNKNMDQLDLPKLAKLISDPEHGSVDDDPLDGWAAIYMFFRRAWWSRSWIIQEATSTVETLFFVGTDGISVDFIASTLGVCGMLHSKHGEKLWGNIDPGWATRLDHLRLKRRQGAWLPFLNLLDTFRHSCCENPRDKIFAALPLASDVAEGDITPDYCNSVGAVYTDLVSFQITKAATGHKLDFLGDIVCPETGTTDLVASPSSLPSWVPDWRLPLLNSQFGKRLEINLDRNENDSQPENHTACHKVDLDGDLVYHAGTAYEPKVKIHGRRLLVHGYLVSHITQLSSPNTNLLPTDTSIEDSWLSLPIPSQAYPSGCSAEEALAHTMVADVQLVNGSFISRGFRLNKEGKGFTKESALEMHIRLTSMKVATFKRRLAWTESGYIGLVPEKAEIGDAVCMFFGGQVLYVLRALPRENSKEDLYEFIGECYFHGLMDGEISILSTESVFKEETFQIV